MIENKQRRPMLIATIFGVFWGRQSQRRPSEDLLCGSRQTKRMRLKLKRRRQVFSKIFPITSAGIKMRLVYHAPRRPVSRHEPLVAQYCLFLIENPGN